MCLSYDEYGPVAGKHSNRRSLPYASSMAYLGRTTSIDLDLRSI